MEQETKSSLWEIVKFVAITLAIVIPIRAFVAQPFIVSGSSMVPTFENGQYLIVDELSYLFRDPSRGEVIIFRYPKDPSKFFIKRVVGLPGETINIRDNKVTINNGNRLFALDEKYINGEETLEPLHKKLSANEYFVLGDNRNASLDSRFWGGVDRSLIRGRVLLRLLPPTQIGYLPGDATNVNN
ncbi:MAG: signal peptidase I [bacterium]